MIDEEPTDQAGRLLLVDQFWYPDEYEYEDEEDRPAEAIIGYWPVSDDGQLGRFSANPGYRPSDEESPSDPLDAVLHLLVDGEARSAHLQVMMAGHTFDVAMNGDGRPMVLKEEDGVMSVVVTTGEPHRERFRSPDVRRTDLAGLVDLIGEDHDVVLNPGGPSATRLANGFVRSTAEFGADELDAITQTFRDIDQLVMAGPDAELDQALATS
ncbi:type VII secretion system-associated protein [Amycolatopsis sp. WAC 04197]|uniref:type VII secretion system-associated protein n=1 Tax=Amycolatopsis sp. WAC 04197 TaxID=2203199 RepID=UPI001F361921|nr:type VII secretion system-associated protein [Amycolatopsis sp. WAC 04197]